MRNIFFPLRLARACGDATFGDCLDSEELTFEYKWGMDGASGQSEYKQVFKNCTDGAIDSSILMISLVPLAIISGSVILWINKQASSTKYCRPIRFMFAKETKESVQREYSSVQDEIDQLTTTLIDVNGRKLHANHKLFMTMVDGKLINEINDSSDCNCNICGATPKQMNNFDIIEELECNECNYSFGISSLHCWIRFLECLLKIAFRLPIEKWKVMKGDKDEVDRNKKRIQDAFYKKKGWYTHNIRIIISTLPFTV